LAIGESVPDRFLIASTHQGRPAQNHTRTRGPRPVKPILKEQCLWAELCDTADELRRAVTAWTHTYNNTHWLTQRHGHQTPAEAFASATTEVAA
jgi:hypothetical protein